MQVVNNFCGQIDQIISEPDNGIYDAFNKGINISKGDVIFFLNSDDFLFDNKVIEKIANVFQQNDQLECVYGNVKVLNGRTGFSHIKGFRDLSIEDIKNGVWPQHPALFLKRDVYREYMFNSSYRIAGDLDLIIKVFRDHADFCHYVDFTVTVFRQDGISNHLDTILETWTETNEIFRSHFGLERYHLHPAMTSMLFYKKWVETLLMIGRPLSLKLKQEIHNVAIFGSLELAVFIQKDLLQAGISTVTFLDNNTYRQGDQIDGIYVRDPQWLSANHKYLDAVIIAIEHDCYDEIRQQIDHIVQDNRIQILTWRELVALNCHE
jgi:glycosyltransferase involved in cell wall biosynthesis